MPINTNLYSFVSRSTGIDTKPTSTQKPVYGRVLDVILDDSHPDYELLGGIEALYTVKYEIYNENSIGEQESAIGYAKPVSLEITTIPLLSEIVEIINAPSYSLTTRNYENQFYYKSIINVWNSTHHNSLPNISQNATQAYLGTNTTELTNLQNLQPFPGDIILQGRFGQSIRFTGFRHPKNTLTDNSNNGSPITILSNNGPKSNSDPFIPRVEDVNKDDTIGILASNHTIPLETTIELSSTYKKDPTITDSYIPTSPSLFKGAQFVLNSSRIVLNARNDSVLLYGNKSVGLAGQSVNLEGREYVAFNAPKVYLGSNSKGLSQNEKNPIVLGNQLEELLQDIIGLLEGISLDFKTASTPAQAALALTKVGNSMPIRLKELSNKVKTIKSGKVFAD